VVKGARQHNLKEVSCHFPHGHMTVITGPSGSGKSSLAFDTLFAEGQRRFLESLSPYVRQFLERVEKPDVDSIEGILPAIALEQHNSITNARSTVGTATTCQDHVANLFGHVGQPQCHVCGSHKVGLLTPEVLIAGLSAEVIPLGTRLWVVAPVALAQHTVADLVQAGFFRTPSPQGDALLELAVTDTREALPEAYQETGELPLLLDRLVWKNTPDQHERLAEALKQARRLGAEALTLATAGTASAPSQPLKQVKPGYACADCGTPAQPPSVGQFSFNTPLGACTVCEGYGRVITLDEDRIIPNRDASLAEGAVHPFQTPANLSLQAELLAACKRHRIPTNVPYRDLSLPQRDVVWQGDDLYPGINGFFGWLETKRYKIQARITLARYRGYVTCGSCKGSRLKPEALRVFVAGKSYLDWVTTPISTLRQWVEALPQALGLATAEASHAVWVSSLIEPLAQRLLYLDEVGLGYLTLQRTMRTLSGGEAQRIHLAAALGTALTDTLYVLDEPTVGLHPRDTAALLRAITRLKDTGNTVVLVEHDPDVMRHADHILDIGPASGAEGGRLIFEGKLADLLAVPYSLTAHYLDKPLNPALPPKPAPPDYRGGDARALKPRPVSIVGATGHNLKRVNVTLPTHELCVVTGVSGAGKSTLIRHTLYGQYLLSKGELPDFDPTPCQAVTGLDVYDSVELVDQSPLGRSLRSNPVTYVKAFDDIRTLLAKTPKAMALGLKAGDFSFNSVGGRCETCEGLGFISVDMQFMADVHLTCPDCDGQRYQPAVLSIDYNNLNITEILNLSVNEAVSFFKTSTSIKRKLEPLQELGLGYLRLGQSTATLSGGEAQRLKLAPFLPPKGALAKKPTLFLFDEPTTGLHLSDVETLMGVLRRLVSAGHGVVVIEHHLDVMALADHIVDLGPSGGEAGGRVVVQGSPAQVAACADSVTGQYLKDRLAVYPACSHA
jgi:excinuclease ABC subunit A